MKTTPLTACIIWNGPGTTITRKNIIYTHKRRAHIFDPGFEVVCIDSFIDFHLSNSFLFFLSWIFHIHSCPPPLTPKRNSLRAFSELDISAGENCTCYYFEFLKSIHIISMYTLWNVKKTGIRRDCNTFTEYQSLQYIWKNNSLDWNRTRES